MIYFGAMRKKNAPKDFVFVRATGGIEEYTLRKNGLRVLFHEDRSAPLGVVMVTYHVGSRNEAAGYTGATHMLEHLLFKGSKHFNKEKGGLLHDILETTGAYLNADTYLDRTRYFEVVPKEYIELAIRGEADRMRNATFSDADRQTEMPVVRNEFERGRNNPMEVLDEQIWGSAFHAHPYHHPTIGWRSDIEHIPTSRLRFFYDLFYWPNNATVIVFGDIGRHEALRAIAREFGKHKASTEPIPPMYTEEPPQEGERRVTLFRPGGMRAVGVAHKTPMGLHADTPAFLLLQKILNEGRSSRFEQNLIETGVAAGVDVFTHPLHDPGLFIVYVMLTSKGKHEEAESVISATYKTIAAKGVSSKELKKAKAQLFSDMAFHRDGVRALADVVSESVSLGDWTFSERIETLIRNVTPADIKRIAGTYFTDDKKTAGYLKEEHEKKK